MSRPFSAWTKAAATRFSATLIRNRHLFYSIRLIGEWRDRRFVVVNLEPAPQVTEPVHDLDELTLTLPIVDDPGFYVRECARFGAVVASAFRKRKNFDRVVGSDSKIHLVHTFHHVALCQYKGPWPQFKSPSEGECGDCIRVASTPPTHRAPMHPLPKTARKND